MYLKKFPPLLLSMLLFLIVPLLLSASFDESGAEENGNNSGDDVSNNSEDAAAVAAERADHSFVCQENDSTGLDDDSTEQDKAFEGTSAGSSIAAVSNKKKSASQGNCDTLKNKEAFCFYQKKLPNCGKLDIKESMLPSYPSWRLEPPISESPDIRAYKKFATDPQYQDRAIIGVDGSKIITAELSDRGSSESSALDDQMPSVYFHSEGRHNVYRSEDTRNIVAHFKEALAVKYGKEKVNEIFNPEDEADAIACGLRQYQVKRVFEEAEKLTPSELLPLIDKCSDEIEEEKERLDNPQLENSYRGYISLKIGNLRLRFLKLVSRLPEEMRSVHLDKIKVDGVDITDIYFIDAADMFASVAEKIADGINVEDNDAQGALKNISDLEQYLDASEKALALIESEPFQTLVLPRLLPSRKDSLSKEMQTLRQRLHNVRVEMQRHPTLARRAELLRQEPAPKKPILSVSNASTGAGSSTAVVISSQAPMTEENMMEKQTALRMAAKTAHDAILVKLDAQKIKDQEEQAKLKWAKKVKEWGF